MLLTKAKAIRFSLIFTGTVVVGLTLLLLSGFQIQNLAPSPIYPSKINYKDTSIELTGHALDENGEWFVPDNNGAYLNYNPLNSDGSVIIYGHNHKNGFGVFLSSEIGDEIAIVGDNGETYHYQINQTLTTSETDILNEKAGHRLIIITCIDNWTNLNRRFLVAEKLEN